MSIRDDEFWAGFLGIDPSDWATSGVSVHEHVGLRGFRGFWCFRRNQRMVVSAPAAWVPRLTEIVRTEGASQGVMLQSFWLRALADDFEQTIGPAFQGRLESANFKPAPNQAVRPVDEDSDGSALHEFRMRCGPEWNMPDKATFWRHAYFDEGRIVALAGYRNWSDHAGDPCVITQPDARGRGRGTAVTSAVVAQALAHGKLLLYQTLESNEPAMRIALSLGYERYANHLAVRLKRDAPHR